MLQTMHTAGVNEPVLLLGHMGIYRGLVSALRQQGELAEQDEAELFRCVQRKSESDIRALLGQSDLAGMMAALPQQMLQVTAAAPTLDQVRHALNGAPQAVLAALDELETLIALVLEQGFCESLRIDVSELSGYGYHTGPVFAVYHPTAGSALAQGGRYDGVGEVFGRARPATGFDVMLKNLVLSAAQQTPAATPVIFAPWVDQAARASLILKVRELRQQGHVVWSALSAQEIPTPQMRVLQLVNGEWQLADQ